MLARGINKFSKFQQILVCIIIYVCHFFLVWSFVHCTCCRGASVDVLLSSRPATPGISSNDEVPVVSFCLRIDSMKRALKVGSLESAT